MVLPTVTIAIKLHHSFKIYGINYLLLIDCYPVCCCKPFVIFDVVDPIL